MAANKNRGQLLRSIIVFAFIAAAVAVVLILYTNIGNLRTNLNNILNTTGQLEADLSKAQQEIRALEREIKDLESKNTELKFENLELEDRIEQIQSSYRAEMLYCLADLKMLDPDIAVELRYATKNNFTGQQIYPGDSKALLRRETALKLIKANEIFKKDGYTIKIWDAYRPLSAQQILWDHSPGTGFVSNPKNGSKHNRGASVDMTLIDSNGNELEMPTGFDDFTEKAGRKYTGHTQTAKKNMDYMTGVMQQCGFKGISHEWWHYDDLDWANYPLLDVSFDEFKQ